MPLYLLHFTLKDYFDSRVFTFLTLEPKFLYVNLNL